MTDTPTAVEEIALELCPECTRELYGASETGPAVGTLDSECSACGVEYRRAVLSSPLMREVVEVLEAQRNLIALLRADLKRFQTDDVTTCDGCGAPIDHDESALHSGDVVGCWGIVSDNPGTAPCWRYRTDKGQERSWPTCKSADDARTVDALLAKLKEAGS